VTWLLLAASSRDAAERHAARHDLDLAGVFDRYELIADRRALTRHRAEPELTDVAIHSFDWRHEPMPQLYEAALLPFSTRRLWLIDERTGTRRRLRPARLAAGLAAAPFAISAAGLGAVAGARRFARRHEPAPGRGRAGGSGVLAIWTVAHGSAVGGAISHIAGILQGLGATRRPITLVTNGPPPAQVAAVADEVVVVGGGPPAARATADLAALSVNRALVTAGREVAARSGRPEFIYQRHEPFRYAGAELARALDVPLVLEWNASLAWTYGYWAHDAKPLKGLGHRLIGQLEGRMVAEADLIASVSTEATAMAVEAGADPGRIVLAPNAVDIGAIDDAIGPNRPAPQRGLVGWVGTYGDWHGADVLVRAAAHSGARIELLMIGDGRGQAACVELAAELGVADRITWQGRTQHADAMRLLGGCDVLCAPTVELAGGRPFFGSPTKLFEYMALGRPIVASRLGQTPDVVEDGRSALLTEPGDARDVARAIDRLVGDPQLGSSLAAAARADAEALHTWDRRAETILTALRSVA
jgi:glycosyltransferase involved in cell wall biosynthesis